MRNSFFLIIPSQQKNADLLKQYEEQALKQWIMDLPVANPGLATRLFHDFIKDFNKMAMDTQLRLDTLETLKPSFLDIEEYLRARLTKTGFPKGENEQKILEVIVSIEKEFTISYWMVVKELTKRTIGWFQGKNTALAIQRTIKGLSNIVVTHYMMCLPVPPWVWIDLHALYSLSVKVKKHNVKIPEDLDRPSKAYTAEECYLQVLLLSLTEPGGLMQKEVQQVYSFLAEFAPLVQLEKKPIAVQMLQCVVLIDEDAPPVFEPTERMLEANKLYLNFANFYDAFDQRDKMVSSKEGRFNAIYATKATIEKLPLELIDYLGQRWLGTELHGMPCFSDRLDRYFSIGLETTYDLLHSDAETEFSGCEYLALSSSDRTLSCAFEKEGLVAIGSLVSFRKISSRQNNRALGVINKIIMPKQKNAYLDFEIQLISSQIYAADYSLPTAKNTDPTQKALFYEQREINSERKFIIVDSFLLKEEDVIRLFMPQEECLVILTDKKNVGLGYWQFGFKRFIDHSIKAEKTAQDKRKAYDFI